MEDIGKFSIKKPFPQYLRHRVSISQNYFFGPEPDTGDLQFVNLKFHVSYITTIILLYMTLRYFNIKITKIYLFAHIISWMPEKSLLDGAVSMEVYYDISLKGGSRY